MVHLKFYTAAIAQKGKRYQRAIDRADVAGLNRCEKLGAQYIRG